MYESFRLPLVWLLLSAPARSESSGWLLLDGFKEFFLPRFCFLALDFLLSFFGKLANSCIVYCNASGCRGQSPGMAINLLQFVTPLGNLQSILIFALRVLTSKQ